MARRRQCAKCGEHNAATANECKNCGNVFAPVKEEKSKAVALCAFTDHGHVCPCRGIVSLSAGGDGPWYCREHIEVIQARAPTVLGNAIPAPLQSRAVKEWHSEMAAYQATRLPVPDLRVPEREPGEDLEETLH